MTADRRASTGAIPARNSSGPRSSPARPAGGHDAPLPGPVGTFLAPRSVDVADNTLAQLARWLVGRHRCRCGRRDRP